MKKITTINIPADIHTLCKAKNINFSDLCTSLLLSYFESQKTTKQQLLTKIEEQRAKITKEEAELHILQTQLTKQEEIERLQRDKEWELEKKKIVDAKQFGEIKQYDAFKKRNRI